MTQLNTILTQSVSTQDCIKENGVNPNRSLILSKLCRFYQLPISNLSNKPDLLVILIKHTEFISAFVNLDRMPQRIGI